MAEISSYNDREVKLRTQANEDKRTILALNEKIAQLEQTITLLKRDAGELEKSVQDKDSKILRLQSQQQLHYQNLFNNEETEVTLYNPESQESKETKKTHE